MGATWPGERVNDSRRRNRTWIVIAATLAVFILLVVVVELLLRALIPGAVAEKIRGELGLPVSQEIDVSLGGSALWYALQGGIGDVSVSTANAEFIEGLPLNATAHVGFIPFDPTSGDLRDASVQLSVAKDQLGSVIELVTDGVANTGEVRDGALVVGKNLELFGTETSIEASIGIGVTDGNLDVTPLGIEVAGLALDAERIHEATGSLLDPLTEERQICVGDRLPAGLTLTAVKLSQSQGVTLEARLDPAFFIDDVQRQPGACES